MPHSHLHQREPPCFWNWVVIRQNFPPRGLPVPPLASGQADRWRFPYFTNVDRTVLPSLIVMLVRSTILSGSPWSSLHCFNFGFSHWDLPVSILIELKKRREGPKAFSSEDEARIVLKQTKKERAVSSACLSPLPTPTYKHWALLAERAEGGAQCL